MSVEIEPRDLGFRRPLTVEVSEKLTIKNPHPYPVVFKVKTTAPKHYCVRPNSGRVEAGGETEVRVILQAMKQEPPPGAKCKDKFLVQSLPVPSDKVFTSLADIWDVVDKGSVIERKIRVVYLSADGSTDAADLADAQTPMRRTVAFGSEAASEAPPAYSSQRDFPSNAPENFPSTARENSPDDEDTGVSSSGAVLATSTGRSGDVSYDELKTQLAKAEKMIAQLKQDQAGLRQRKTGAAGEEKIPPAQLAQATRAGTEGVPIRITAALCFLSFLLAYLFF